MSETALVLIDFQEERTNPNGEYYVGDIKGRNLKVLVDNNKKAIVTAFWIDS